MFNEIDVNIKSMENFYTSIEPLCIFQRFLGFFPQTFEKPVTEGYLSATNCSIIQTICAIIVILASIIGNIIHFYVYEINKGSFFTDSIWNWILMLGMTFVLLQFIYQMNKMDEIKMFFKLMHSIDVKLSYLTCGIDFIEERKFVKKLSVIFACLLIARVPIVALLGFEYNVYNVETMVSEIMYNIHLSYECLFCLQFFVFTYILRERFRLLRGFIG